MSSYTIQGHVAKGYETVYSQFETNFIDGLEENAQLCVYVGEELVVDLWGFMNTSANYDGDTLANVFSSGKSLAAICIATLVNKKLLNYSDKVVSHWPEYGNGSDEKESLLVADILRHQGGMANFSQTVRLIDIQADNIKKNSIGRIIEEEPLCYPPESAGTKTQYHAMTRGWILNEIFRRVDPEHRTIGECLREEISTPLNADCYIGLSFEQLPRAASLSTMPMSKVIRQSMIPKSLGRKTELGFIDILKMMGYMAKLADKKKSPNPPLELMPVDSSLTDIVLKYQMSVVRSGEIPSANSHCSARGLAKIAAMMANKGSINGTEILSEETWSNFHHGYEQGETMYPFAIPVNFSQGGVNFFKPNENISLETMRKSSENRKDYIGWMGLGGSVFQWCPEHKIGFAYVPTLISWDDLNNGKAALLQKITMDCAKQATI